MASRDPDIVGDSKDWTWVLEKRCPECEYVATDVDRSSLPSTIRANAGAWAQMIDDGEESWLRARPRPDKWSPLEYAFHVRDVFELYDYRLSLMMDRAGPEFPDWNQDETAVEKRYNEADPANVRVELVKWAEALAARFEGVSGVGWQRTGLRSDGAHFTVDTFGRYMIHDPIHHLWDVHAG